MTKPITAAALKPCPFCGGKASLWKNTAYWGIICRKSPSCIDMPDPGRGSMEERRAELITAWNTRPLDEAAMNAPQPSLVVEDVSQTNTQILRTALEESCDALRPFIGKMFNDDGSIRVLCDIKADNNAWANAHMAFRLGEKALTTLNPVRSAEVGKAIDRIERGLLGFTDDTAFEIVLAYIAQLEANQKVEG